MIMNENCVLSMHAHIVFICKSQTSAGPFLTRHMPTKAFIHVRRLASTPNRFKYSYNNYNNVSKKNKSKRKILKSV